VLDSMFKIFDSVWLSLELTIFFPSPKFLLYSTINLFSEASFVSFGSSGLAATVTVAGTTSLAAELTVVATGAVTIGTVNPGTATPATLLAESCLSYGIAGAAPTATAAAEVTATSYFAILAYPLVGSSKYECPF